MLAAHRFCSEHKFDSPSARRGSFAALGFGALLALGGCNVSKGLDLETTSALKKENEKTTSTSVKATKPTTRGKASANVGKRVTLKAAKSYGTSTKISDMPEYANPVLSARCREILARAGVETTILRSPTIAGEANDEGEVGASISYDFVDLRRASLKDDLALVKCRHNYAATKLGQLLLTSPQALSRAGYLAKARALRKSRKGFDRIKRQISGALQRGVLTVQVATGLRQHVDHVKSREADALGEAARREVIDDIQLKNFADLDRELLQTERDAHRIERKLRTADALKFNVSGGYSADTGLTDNIVNNNGGAYAKVKVSMRLGAFSQRRRDYENEIGAARQDSYYEQYTGGFWKAREIIRANKRAVDALVQQRAQIIAALKQANRNAVRHADDFELEIVALSLRAKIDRLALKADLAAVDATIADTRRVARKLRFR